MYGTSVYVKYDIKGPVQRFSQQVVMNKCFLPNL